MQFSPLVQSIARHAMCRPRWGLLVLSIAVLFAGANAQSAFAGPIYSFGTQSVGGNTTLDGSQFKVEVIDAGSNSVRFRFTNEGPVSTSLTDIYFDDGTLLGAVMSVGPSGPGVSFSQGASPGDLSAPSGLNFEASAGFTADSDSPTSPNGINPGEWLDITFALQTGNTYAGTLASLEWALANPNNSSSQGLRIGIRVQSIPSQYVLPTKDNSDAFINGGMDDNTQTEVPGVPEPASMTMLAIGVVGMAGYGWRRRRQASAV